MRRKHKAVSTLLKLLAKQALHLHANNAALRMPKDQSLTVIVRDREQIEFAS